MKLKTNSLVNYVNQRIRLLSVVVLSAVLCYSCNSSEDDTDAIDYSSLGELSTEVVLEIGESDDYLPDYIDELVVTGDGTILAYDNGHTTIEQFDSDGTHLGTVAREGQGPGELDNVSSLHVLNEDTLIVQSRSGRKDYFVPEEDGDFNHITTEQSNHSDRRMDIVKAVRGDKFYAVKTNLPSQAGEMTDPKTTIHEAFVVVDENENVLDDSLHVLQRRGRFGVELEGGGFVRAQFPFQNQDLAVPLEEGNYLIARPDSSTFFVYNEDHELDRKIPVNIKDRPITEEDLEYEFENTPDEVISEIEKVRPDTKPPYTKVVASENYFWLLTDESKEGKEIAVLDDNGEPVGRFMLSEHESLAHTEDDKIYVIHDHPERGHEIRVYEIDLRT